MSALSLHIESTDSMIVAMLLLIAVISHLCNYEVCPLIFSELKILWLRVSSTNNPCVIAQILECIEKLVKPILGINFIRCTDNVLTATSSTTCLYMASVSGWTYGKIFYIRMHLASLYRLHVGMVSPCAMLKFVGVGLAISSRVFFLCKLLLG